MPDQLYNWTRFWVPRESTVSLADGGYLYEPYTRDLQRLKDLKAIPCQALLAEPGMGKTCTLKAEREALEAVIADQGSKSLWLDLRSYGSEDRLIRNLFESDVFRAWVQGSHRLHIFLDSLDEALLRIETIAALLVPGSTECDAP